MSDYIHNLAIAAMLCSLIGFITPDGKIKSIVEFSCACAILLCFMCPLTGYICRDLQAYLDGFNEEMTKLELSITESTNSAVKGVIAQGYCEYIKEEAIKCGVHLSGVKVTLQMDENNLEVPLEIYYITDHEVSEDFMSQMENELGVPRERQMRHEAAVDD